MKRRAFFQALVLFLLLTGSWILLLLSLRSGSEDDSPPEPDPLPKTAPEPASPASVRDSPSGSSASASDPLPNPPGWEEWLGRLDAVASPAEMRAALGSLREELFSLPADKAIDRLLAFLESGFDLRTGLAFQVGPGGALTGAASLRALLLDWLGQLDPALAADWARSELLGTGTGLVPDVFVIHLRNYEWGSPAPESDRRAFLAHRFGELLRHDPWINNPGTALAEAMDVPVHARATGFIPDLTALMEPGRPPLLRRAAALSVERLVDREPLEALSELLRQADRPTPLPKARAGYFARLDPTLEAAPEILDPYLSAPGVSREEAVFFLRSFPNLNQSFSHNLLSSNNAMTDGEEIRSRLHGALDLINRWREDPAMLPLRETLEAEAERIRRQLGEGFSP